MRIAPPFDDLTGSAPCLTMHVRPTWNPNAQGVRPTHRLLQPTGWMSGRHPPKMQTRRNCRHATGAMAEARAEQGKRWSHGAAHTVDRIAPGHLENSMNLPF